MWCDAFENLQKIFCFHSEKLDVYDTIFDVVVYYDDNENTYISIYAVT